MEHPCKRRRGGLVAGHEEREHLVQQLLVLHRLAVLVTGLDQHRQHIGAPARPLPAAPRDLGQEDCREVPPIPHEAAPRREAPEVDAQRRDEEECRCRAVGEREEPEEARPQARELLSFVDSEDGAQDHVERDRLQLAVHRERTAERPGVDHAAGDLPHDAPVDVDAFAVERRQQELALPEVTGAVEHEERVPAQDGAEHPGIPFAAAQLVGVAREDVPDGLGVREDHRRRLPEGARREAMAPAAPALLHGLIRPANVAEALEERRSPRPGGKSRAWGRTRRPSGRRLEPGFGQHGIYLPGLAQRGSRPCMVMSA